MNRFRLAAALALILSAAIAAHGQGKLHVYFIDVEGGQSTLFVTPEHESLLIDTGWPGNDSRDAGRIADTAKKAGLSKIDYVLITHYHVDHAGGIPQLLAKIPVGTFLDHGPNRELDKGITEKDYADYQKILAEGKSKSLHLKPGDPLPLKGLSATVISADGNLIQQPLPGGGEANPDCQGAPTPKPDETENSRSLGIALHYGKLKLLDLGDLTQDKEMQLACPVNKLGRFDIYIVSHHGWEQSSSKPFVDALHARVAIMDNGAKKGGSTPVLKTIQSAPGLEALWQLHFSEEGGQANNTAEPFIANLTDAPADKAKGPDAGHYLELIAAKDGSFDIYNSRTQATKHYSAPK